MNYEKIYNHLIDRYGTYEKPKGIYTERHRKIPGHAGGKYVEGNAFYVPARVHYIAHQLLARVTRHPKDKLAVWGMMNQKSSRDYRVTSRAYESAKVACLPALREGGNAGAAKTHSVKNENGKSIAGVKGAVVLNSRKDENGKSVVALKMLAKLTPEQLSRGGKKGAAVLHANWNPEWSKKGGKIGGVKSAAKLHSQLAHAREHGESSPYWESYQRMLKNKAEANRATAARAKPFREECKSLCSQLGISKLAISNNSTAERFIVYRAQLQAMLSEKETVNG